MCCSKEQTRLTPDDVRSHDGGTFRTRIVEHRERVLHVLFERERIGR